MLPSVSFLALCLSKCYCIQLCFYPRVLCLQPCVCLDVAVRVFCPVSVLMLLCVFIDLFILFTTWGKSCAARIAPAQLMTSATQCGSSDHVTQAGNLPFFGLRLLAERSLSRKKHNEKNLFFFFFFFTVVVVIFIVVITDIH